MARGPLRCLSEGQSWHMAISGDLQWFHVLMSPEVVSGGPSKRSKCESTILLVSLDQGPWSCHSEQLSSEKVPLLGLWDFDILNIDILLKFGKCLLWQSDICEMEPSLCPAGWRTISVRKVFLRIVGECMKRALYPSCYLLSIIHLTSCMAPIVGPGKGERLDTCLHFWKWEEIIFRNS